MSGLAAGPNFRLLSSGDRLYAYSGVIVGDITLPATIQLLKFENSGLRDLFLKIIPFYGAPISTSADQLGVIISIDGVTIFTHQIRGGGATTLDNFDSIDLFVPKQSSLEVLSLNTAANNTQERGCNALGWYL